MKRVFAITMCVLLAVTLLASCGKAAPTAITIASDGILLRGAGDTADLVALVTAQGTEDAALVYTSSDTAVADVSEAGILTAKADGTATVTVSAAADARVFAAVDVLVYDYAGVYTAQKYIDAMGCSIRVRITLGQDGTFAYYRYPMVVALDGGGQMPPLSDSGSYTVSGSTVTCTAQALGSFTLELHIVDGSASLEGKVPTGGAPTQMQLVQNAAADGSENGTYSGSGESEDGKAISYALTLTDGAYTLTANEAALSKGSYTFAPDGVEFSASEGASFTAAYDAARAVVEGTSVPADAEGLSGVAVTLTKGAQ